MARTRRVQVPLTDETRSALQAYANASNTSLAAACATILEQSASTALELSKALTAAHRAPSKAVRQALETINRVTMEAEQVSMDLGQKVRTRKKRK